MDCILRSAVEASLNLQVLPNEKGYVNKWSSETIRLYI